MKALVSSLHSHVLATVPGIQVLVTVPGYITCHINKIEKSLFSSQMFRHPTWYFLINTNTPALIYVLHYVLHLYEKLIPDTVVSRKERGTCQNHICLMKNFFLKMKETHFKRLIIVLICV